MAAGKTHETINVIIAVMLSIYLYFRNYDILLIGYLDAGIIYFTFIENPDLDILKSRVTQLWGQAGIIWKPFVSSGHREILHSFFWGPFILIGFADICFSAIYMIYTKHVDLVLIMPKEAVAGGVIAIWSHIITDKL
jgi:uncharacterized metal-binding protein